MRKRYGPITVLSVLVALFLGGCVFVTLPGVKPLTEKVIGGEGREKVLLVDISGIIRDKAEKEVVGIKIEPNLTARVREELDKAAEDDRVRAVVLRINSPGGAVTTSDIIVHEIREFKKKRNVPVVAELMDLATSGGYYVATAADEIIAHPTTVTGSIGVVAYSVDASGLLSKIGVAGTAIKSGDKKDMGSPLRSMTPEEREIIQGIIDSMYERFLDTIMVAREGRITRGELREAADGRVMDAQEALRLKLIDRIGYMDEAVEAAKELAGLEEATVVTYAPPTEYRNNVYSTSTATARAGLFPSTVNLVNIDAGPLSERYGMSFMYLWMP